MRVLAACEFSGRVRDAFALMGCDAWSCDLLPSETPGKHIRGDVLDVLGDGWDVIVAFPPCTDLSAAGAWAWPAKLADGRQEKAFDFFRKLAEAPAHMVAVENPVGIVSTWWRTPDQIFHPYYFGDPWKKRTCLWLRGLPPLERVGSLDDGEVWVEAALPGENQWKDRSRTFPAVAAAMASQWVRHAASVHGVCV